MSSVTEERVVAPVLWTMPEAEVGDIVLWYADANPEVAPRVAVVNRVSERSLRIVFLEPNAPLQPKNTVRHMSDPQIKANNELRKDGGWKHKDSYLRMQKYVQGQIEQSLAKRAN